MTFQAKRYHDISCGHRVVGHEGKCRHLHGHNYRVHFTCEAERLDMLGRVIDFSVIKEKLCMWLEANWDHKFLAWEGDELIKNIMRSCGPSEAPLFVLITMVESVVWTPFNPTAENIARYLVETVGPSQLQGTGVTLIHCEVEETRKCSSSFTRTDPVPFGAK